MLNCIISININIKCKWMCMCITHTFLKTSRFQNFNFSLVNLFSENFEDDLDPKIDNFKGADNGESSKKTQSSSDGCQHVHKLGSSVLGDLVKCSNIKVDPHKFQI